ncbi:hypothetical protein [Burkholderia vietnamiensis]|uniref:hypothetical protein n=1 Tax=Burkholderia vietnamiensis TaxID=60552 RepID=UPI0012D494EA|nr:hypothetical protein [Burkholderia vietnamiensis]
MKAMSICHSHLLKQLETRLSKLRAERDMTKQALREAEAAHVAAGEKVRAVEQEIASLKDATSEPVLTEHALLRYIERVHGIDLDQIRAQMLTPAVTEQIRTLRSCRLPIGNGGILAVEAGDIKTVATKDSREKRIRQVHGLRPVEVRRLQAEEEGPA